VITKPLVFVSSTSTLQDERRTLRQALPAIYELYLYEEDRARRASPEKHVRARIERADVFLGILAGDYGTPFPGAGEKRSIVEWEHDVAMRRSGLEVFAFVKEIPSAQRDPRQQSFIERLQGFDDGLWRRTYQTPADLADQVHVSLEQWLAEFYTRFRDRRAAFRTFLALPLTAVPIMSVLGLLAVVLSGQASSLPRNAIVGLCLTVEVIVALCGVVLLWVSGGARE
jgi:hypothetical protein